MNHAPSNNEVYTETTAPTAAPAQFSARHDHGFTGLLPKERWDRNRQRSMTPEMGLRVTELRKELLELNVMQFYKCCIRDKMIGEPPLCQQTVRRYLKAHGLFLQGESIKARKRYEMDRFGEFWVGDFMHGPMLDAPKRRKAVLLGIIDDHSRVIVGHRWSFQESTLPLEHVLKDALLKYGIPDKLYVDNGPSFISDYLRLVCAHLNIALIHSKPYDSPSRGKIERFWRTVREGFLPTYAHDASKPAKNILIDLARLKSHKIENWRHVHT